MEDVYMESLSDAPEQTRLISLAAADNSSELELTSLQQATSSNGSSSTNSNGNANNEIAEVDISLNTTSSDSIAATIPFQLNYTQAHEQVSSWLPSFGTTFMHSFLPQTQSTDSGSSPTTKDSPSSLLVTSETTPTLANVDSSSMISSPSSSTTTSSSPPDSAAVLCSPPSSLLPNQGVFVDMLAGQPGPSQDAEEERNSPQVCLWEGCNMEFQNLSQLVAHLDKGHTLAMSQYVCYWKGCPRNLKPFDARYKLITHLRCHTGEKPFKCEIPSCNRCFSRLENLKLHVRTHTGEKPYECHYGGCSKRFNNTSDRAKHMKTHVMRKPYACKYPGCEKSYTDPSSMRKHIKYSHKLKEKPEHESNSRSSNNANSVVCLTTSLSSSSSLPRTPSLSPSSVMFHSPTVTALSPPVHSPLASLPQESARITHTTATANLKRNLTDGGGGGAQLIATGPILSSQPQVPQIIPLPLVQLPAGSHYQNQLLGLLPGGSKGMILMPNVSTAESAASRRQPVIIQQTPEQTQPIASASNTSSEREEKSSQKKVEAQLRQKIHELQQELSHTQTLLAHQNAAIAHQNKPLLRQPMLLQQVPPPRMIAQPGPNGHMIVASPPPEQSSSTLSTGVVVTTPTTVAGSTQFIPIVNSQGFQFLYAPSVPHSTV